MVLSLDLKAALAVSLIGGFALLATPATADESARFDACMALVRDNPAQAFDEATTWEGLSNSRAARYCAQAALMAMGKYREAAEGFERLAQTVIASPTLKAELLGNAAEGRLLLGQSKDALALADTALRLSPENVEILLLRARIFADLGAMWEAIDDLDRVLEIEPRHVDALVFRASAYRNLDAYDLALADTGRALSLNPGHASALLERGNTHRLMGNSDKARDVWLDLLERWPHSPQATAARANLERMDINAD